MRVLVAAASRHGSTAEIAEEIAAALRMVLRASDPDAVVDVRASEEVRAPWTATTRRCSAAGSTWVTGSRAPARSWTHAPMRYTLIS